MSHRVKIYFAGREYRGTAILGANLPMDVICGSGSVPKLWTINSESACKRATQHPLGEQAMEQTGWDVSSDFEATKPISSRSLLMIGVITSGKEGRVRTLV